MTSLLLALALAQAPVDRPPPLRTGAAAPFFEAFTASGTGIGTTPCTGAAVTGTKGQAITFARNSAAACMKAGQYSGLVAGDLVMLTANQPRAMAGQTGGASLGLMMENEATNTITYAEELDNAAWTGSSAGGPAVPTVTANAGTAVDNTATAERIQIPATTAGQYSAQLQLAASGGCPTTAGGKVSLSAFVQGVSGTSTIDLTINDGSGAAEIAHADCTYVAATITRCVLEDVTINAGAGAGNVLIGNMTSANGGTNRGAADFYLHGVQCEAGRTASSYIKTTSAAATRVAETASYAFIHNGGNISAGVTVLPSRVALQTSGATTWLVMRLDVNNQLILGAATDAKTRTTLIVGGSTKTQDAANALNGVLNRAAGYFDGSNTGACLEGTCVSSAGGAALPAGGYVYTLYLGSNSAGSLQPFGVVKNIQLSRSSGLIR